VWKWWLWGWCEADGDCGDDGSAGGADGGAGGGAGGADVCMHCNAT
jgi:hypothetical protein